MYRGDLTEVLRKLSYGFYIVSAKDVEQYAAGAVNWVSQVSFQPPLIMIAIRVETSLNDTIRRSRHFAVNILSEEQEHLLPNFFKSTRVDGNKINDLPFAEEKTGAPVFVDCPASLECQVVEEINRGDHTVFIGEVVNAGVRYDLPSLVDKETEYKYAG